MSGSGCILGGGGWWWVSVMVVGGGTVYNSQKNITSL